MIHKKNLIFFLFYLLSFNFADAQNSYYKLINTSSVWNYTGCYGPPPYYTTFYRFKTDTLLNSYQYYRLERSGDSLTWFQMAYPITLLREDTVLKKVWLLSNYTNEGLLYDFNLQTGDSVTSVNMYCMGDSMTYHVQGVDSVLMGDLTYRRKFHVSGDMWIEGIGSQYGLLYPGCTMVGSCENFVCYYQNNQFMYKNPAYPTCFYSNPDDYFKYVDTNKLWNYTETYGMGTPDVTTLFRFKKDTLIGSQTYYIAESTSDSVNWHNLSQYYREEDRKVYIWHDGTESLVFDAGAYIGDTLQIFHDDMGNPVLCPDTCLIKIMAIDLVNTGGLYRKRFYFQYLNCPGANDYWITGIGFQYGIVKHCFQYVGPPMLRLVCYYENDTMIFRNPAYTTCFSVWVNNAGAFKDASDAPLLKYYDNGKFALESNSIIQQIKVYSINSQEVINVLPHNYTVELNLFHLPQGIYLLKAQTITGEYMYKLVK